LDDAFVACAQLIREGELRNFVGHVFGECHV
jgi:hypothetical protein